LTRKISISIENKSDQIDAIDKRVGKDPADLKKTSMSKDLRISRTLSVSRNIFAKKYFSLFTGKLRMTSILFSQKIHQENSLGKT